MPAHWWPWPCFHCVSCHQAGNMAVPLLVCTEEKQICGMLLLQKVYNMLKFNICLCAQNRDNALDLRSVYKWTEMLKKGQTSVNDAELTKLKLAKGVYTVVYDSFGFDKVCASNWQNSIITLVRTTAPVTWNINTMKNFNCIINGDDTWNHYELDNHKNMWWKHTTSIISKEFILWPFPGELRPIVFLDSQGPVCELQMWDYSNKCMIF